MAKPKFGDPTAPVEYTNRDVAAIQALMRGDADPGQQAHVLKFIIENVCGTYDLSFRPEPRWTDLAEGKRYVGLQLVKLTKLKIGKEDGRAKRGTEQPS